MVPHPLGEVGVEVAVEDGVPRRLVSIPRSAEVDLVGVGRPRPDPLGVQVVGPVVVGVEQPLVVVQVEDVLLLRAHVDVSELGEVARVAVVDVRRVVLEKGRGGLGADQGHERGILGRHRCGRYVFEPEVGRHVHPHPGVSHREGGQEELLVGAAETIVHGTHAQPVGDDLGADAAGGVVDHEGVAHAVERVAEHRVAEKALEGLRRARLVVPHLCPVTEGFQPVRHRGVANSHVFQRVGRRREAPV